MPAPTPAAVLVVRDEAAHLPDCLTSVRALVHEVVVYDTGSVDGSADLARSRGARVVQGFWDGDFARARNAALGEAGREWVLSMDADERAVGEPDGLARLLDEVPPGVDALTVQVHNPYPEAARDVHVHASARLFRRAALRWEGAVHERLRRPDGSPPVCLPCPPQVLTLLHTGYRDPATIRAKARRNAALARAELDRLAGSDVTDRPALARAGFDLGRSLFAADDPAGGAAALRAALAADPAGAMALPIEDFLVRCRLALGDGAGARAGLRHLRVRGADPRYVDWLTARALLEQGRPAAALALLRSLDTLVDTLGCDLGLGVVLEVRARAAALAGELPEALACLLLAMVGYGRIRGRGPDLLRLWAGRPAADLVALLPELDGAGEAVGPVAEELASCPDPGPALAAALRAAPTRPDLSR
jgi:hypothetical protein